MTRKIESIHPVSRQPPDVCRPIQMIPAGAMDQNQGRGIALPFS
jgi:hypothetical protein